MNDYESIPFVTEDGEEVEFYVLEQTTLNGFHYLLVEDGSADPEEEDVVVYIMKGAAGSEDEEEMAAYEMVEDEGELQAVYAVFQQMLDDVNFEWRSDF